MKKYYIIGLIVIIAILSAAIYAVNFENSSVITPTNNVSTNISNTTTQDPQLDDVSNSSIVYEIVDSVLYSNEKYSTVLEKSNGNNVNTTENIDTFTDKDIPKPEILPSGISSFLYIETNTSEGILRFYPDGNVVGGGYFVMQDSNNSMKYYPEDIIKGGDSYSNITKYCKITQNGNATYYEYQQPAIRYDRDFASGSISPEEESIIATGITTYDWIDSN